METSTLLTSLKNTHNGRFTTGSRVKILSLVMLWLALGVASSMALTNIYLYRGVCPVPNGGKRILDKWYEWECECTSYVADKLNARGIPFHARYKDVLWKGAGTWIDSASAAGVPYNKTPRPGDVAWFAYGHVAYVEAVDSYGDVTISEYNWGVPHDYHTRTISRGTKPYPAYFIHF